jgi:radical SAM-linked protein
LAGLKLNSAERERKPLILGTGGAFINPEPMRVFLDGFVYLWSEKNQAVLAESLKLPGKSEIISELSPVGGFYLSAHSPAAIRAGSERFSIQPAGFPLKPVVPFVEVDQDKLCFGGNNDWPNYSSKSEEVEGTSADRIAEGITTSMHHSGFEAVKIDLGLFPVDAKGLILALEKKIRDRRYVFELENFPLESFDSEVAEIASITSRNRIGFRPIAASQRLRELIGQNFSPETILKTIQTAMAKGFHTVGLGIDIGLPTEHLRDIRELGGLLKQINESFGKSHRAKNLRMDFRLFSPYPGTMWQWDEVLSADEMTEKIARVRENSRTKNLKLYFPEAVKEYWKSILLRGEKSASQVILKAAEQLQQHYPAEPVQIDWARAFQVAGVNSADFARAFKLDQKLPWDDLFSQESKEKLRQTRFSSPAALIAQPEPKPPDKKSCAGPAEKLYGRKAKVKQTSSVLFPSQSKIRMKWVKTERVRFTSHLDAVRMFEKAVRRAEFPVSYSEGFHPHPRIAYGPPLPLGFISDCEYVDMQLETAFNYQLIDRLNSALPEGFRISEARPVFTHSISLSAFINISVYEIELEELTSQQEQALLQLPKQEEVLVTRKTKEAEKQVNIARLIQDLKVQNRGRKKVVLSWLGLGQEGYARPQEVLQHALGLSGDDILHLLFKRVDLLSKKGERYLSPFQVL